MKPQKQFHAFTCDDKMRYDNEALNNLSFSSLTKIRFIEHQVWPIYNHTMYYYLPQKRSIYHTIRD